MSESVFNIFSDHLLRQASKNVLRQPHNNIENFGKTVLTGPIKPNEPLKKLGETKKSFLCNAGKTLQSTPVRQVFTPRAVNVASVYSDPDDLKEIDIEEIEFTRPSYKYDNYQQKDVLDFLPIPEPEVCVDISPPNTPPPAVQRYSMELDCSYTDEFFTDDFYENVPIYDSDLSLPEID